MTTYIQVFKNYIKNNPIVLMVSFFLLNLILKTIFISSTSIAGDEPFSIYHAQMNIGSIISQLSNGNNPPFYEIILHYWITFFGISPLAVRSLSVIASSLTVIFLYKIGKEFISEFVAIVSCLLFSFSNLHILLSHEARVYSILSFLITVSMYHFLSAIKKDNKNSHFIILTITNILIIYAHYFGFFILFLQFVISQFLYRDKKFKKGFWLSFIIIFVAYIPNLYVFFYRFYDSSAHGTWVQPPDGIKSLYGMFRSFSNEALPAIVCILLTIIGFASLFIKWKSIGSLSKLVLILWFIVPFALMFIVSFWVPMFLDRYVMFTSMGYYLMLAIIIESISLNIIIKTTVSFIVLVLFIATCQPNISNKRDIKEAIVKIKELQTPKTNVIIVPFMLTPNIAYYYDQNIFTNVDCVNVYEKMIKNLEKKNVHVLYQIDTNLLNSDKLVFLDASKDYINNINGCKSELDKKYTLSNHYFYYEIFDVYEFKHK